MGFCEYMGLGKNGGEECVREAQIHDFDVQKFYGVGHRSQEEIKSEAENSCMLCFRKFAPLENKIVPPRMVQDRDYFVRNGIVSARYMCPECYSRVRKKNDSHRVSRIKFRRRSLKLRSVLSV